MSPCAVWASTGYNQHRYQDKAQPPTLVIFGALVLCALPAAVLAGLLAYVVVKRLSKSGSTALPRRLPPSLSTSYGPCVTPFSAAPGAGLHFHRG